MRDKARLSPGSRPFGIFGTSIAGTWLYGELGDRTSFFVDEDPARAGKAHLGVRIIAPPNVPANGWFLLRCHNPWPGT
jgi:hypothetical protein